mmetsp:Transcript_31710/g.83035  ORF Transcript_31710/g.83035 Transcript_31710/m.83035 type:complete len:200 (+) Transcript_31710:2228-2827(+)
MYTNRRPTRSNCSAVARSRIPSSLFGTANVLGGRRDTDVCGLFPGDATCDFGSVPDAWYQQLAGVCRADISAMDGVARRRFPRAWGSPGSFTRRSARRTSATVSVVRKWTTKARLPCTMTCATLATEYGSMTAAVSLTLPWCRASKLETSRILSSSVNPLSARRTVVIGDPPLVEVASGSCLGGSPNEPSESNSRSALG